MLSDVTAGNGPSSYVGEITQVDDLKLPTQGLESNFQTDPAADMPCKNDL